MRLLPEGFFPHSREGEQATLPSVLSCTAWGFSCDSAYANARWALAPPFHPYPAPLALGGIFSVTLSVTRNLHSGCPRFHEACCLPVFGLSSGKTGVKPAITRHREQNTTERLPVPVSSGSLAWRDLGFIGAVIENQELDFRMKFEKSVLLCHLLNPLGFAVGQLAVFQGASAVPLSPS